MAPYLVERTAEAEIKREREKESDEESSDEAEPGCARPSGTTNAVGTSAAKSVGEDRPPEIANCNATQSAVPRPVPMDEILELLRTPREPQLPRAQ